MGAVYRRKFEDNCPTFIIKNWAYLCITFLGIFTEVSRRTRFTPFNLSTIFLIILPFLQSTRLSFLLRSFFRDQSSVWSLDILQVLI